MEQKQDIDILAVVAISVVRLILMVVGNGDINISIKNHREMAESGLGYNYGDCNLMVEYLVVTRTISVRLRAVTLRTMNRKEFLKESKRLNGGICSTANCPKCGSPGVSFDDEVKFLGAKCYHCGKVNDKKVTFCGCDV